MSLRFLSIVKFSSIKIEKNLDVSKFFRFPILKCGWYEPPKRVIVQLQFDTDRRMFTVPKQILEHSHIDVYSFPKTNNLTATIEVDCKDIPEFATGDMYQGTADLTGQCKLVYRYWKERFIRLETLLASCNRDLAGYIYIYKYIKK